MIQGGVGEKPNVLLPTLCNGVFHLTPYKQHISRNLDRGMFFSRNGQHIPRGGGVLGLRKI
ncbi:hypothetical protein XENTR_v10006844 [Xenopus tropicalis]|nr:hypothetical protein XENTR_v10006844 [Xenopus tropicalis]KAE8627041.1 hypothetical protein XENTR_v10006844 [Xenopus tropicalis]